MSGQVLAQATTGTIFGSAPTSGATVQVTGGAGVNRTVSVDSTGHYSVTVPVGSYTVNLLQNGTVVQSHSNVSPVAGGASEADFAQAGGDNAKSLGTVTVTANALPAIDVTSTTQNLTITSQQLAQLPLARSSASIALLAPGTAAGAAMLGGGPTGEAVVSFGGSSIVENAYYINGFNTSDPLSNTGGITLPYGSIDQQQTLTSGYGAQYGRSAGGVISQVGKSGTNDWHFGGQVLWAPTFARESAVNNYWNNPLSTTSGEMYGNLQSYNRRENSWNTVYDAYVGGPLIKDTLFLFLSAEADKTQGQVMQSVNAGKMYYYKNSDPKFYGKLDWNINSSNILSLTGIYNSAQNDPSQYYNYDSIAHAIGNFASLGQRNKTSFGIWVAKYTSYITDNLTANLMFGKMDGKYYSYQPPFPGYDPNQTYIGNGGQFQNPAYLSCASCYVNNSNVNLYQSNPGHKSEVRNLRLDFDWKLGNHDIQFGIDNDTDIDKADGQTVTGPGYAWYYEQAGSPTTDAVGGLVGPGTPCVPVNGAMTKGCYVTKYVFTTSASVEVMQRAQYIQDNWQVTPNLLLNIGLRNDQFTNYNPAGQAYLRLTKPQWAPRVGFSWDVFGDSTLKVFGNLGRYYLAMPTAVALRVAGAPLYTNQFYTYSGINSDGTPINPTLIPNSLPNNVYYVNGENGQPIDAKVASAQNLKAEYQDQFVLGMQQQINSSWVYGVTGTVNKIGRAIDDTDAGGPDAPAIIAAAAAQGITLDPTLISQSVLINPGQANTFVIPNGKGGYYNVKVSNAQLGMPQLKRKYYSADLYLEHPFDGKWWAKIDYTFSRSYGNYEGPVQSNIGQGGSSQSGTEQWDFPQIMSYSNGLLANDQKHQLRIYGSYQVTPEWSVGGTYRIASGTPASCLGFYGPQQSDPGGTYGASYHWCNGVPTPGGTTGFTPWTHQLNLQVDYRPEFAKHKLDFSLQIHNVFNEQNPTQYYATYNSGNAPGPGQTAAFDPGYRLPYALENPRYLQFGISYDY
ncbi:TonB-dependent receptor [Dyella agri]